VFELTSCRVFVAQSLLIPATAVKEAVEDDDAKVSDLHVWAIVPNIHAAIVSVVSHQPESPAVYKERIQAHCQSLVHVTVEPLRCD